MNKVKFADIEQFSKKLDHQMLCSLIGNTQTVIRKAQRGLGILAWRDIVQSYDPQTQIDKRVA